MELCTFIKQPAPELFKTLPNSQSLQEQYPDSYIVVRNINNIQTDFLELADVNFNINNNLCTFFGGILQLLRVSYQLQKMTVRLVLYN